MFQSIHILQYLTHTNDHLTMKVLVLKLVKGVVYGSSWITELHALSSVYDTIRMVFDFSFFISVPTTVPHSSTLEQSSHHSQECRVASKF